MGGRAQLRARIEAGECVIAPDVRDLVAAQLADRCAGAPVSSETDR